jgi:hypothetical protein
MVAVQEFYISRSEYEIINDPTKWNKTDTD